MKKLISMFLVFIILIAQFGTTIATDYVTGGPEKQTLENYLIEHCVDLDQNNVLSDTEWASVKQLTLDDTINLNNIEKAVNLKSLWLVGLNLNKLDLSKLANLETLQLTSCQLNELNLSGLTHLKNLTFDAEKCNVMNLNQLTGLKDLAMWNASNLKEIGFSQLSSLETLNLIDCDLTGVDFSSLNKLKNLIITYSKMELPEQNLNLSSLTQLEKLSIYNYGSGIKQLDISKNNNLYSLDLGNTYDCDIKLPEDLSNITYATIASNQIKEIDLRNASNLYYASFSSSNNHWNQNNIKINNDNLYVIKEDNNWKIYQYEGNEIRIANSKEKIEADDIDYIFGGKIASENLTNSKLLKKDEAGNILIKGVGTEQIEVTDDWNRSHFITLTIFENNPDKTLGKTGVTAKIVDSYGRKVLKSNGELWQVYSATEAEIIDTNVKKYVVGQLQDSYWGKSFLQGNSISIENILKQDNTLTIKEEYLDIEKQVKNVQDINQNLYLTTSGDLYEIGVNDITQEIHPKKIKSDVKKIVGDCVVLNDGTTWIEKDYGGNGAYSNRAYSVELEQIADFEIKECGWFVNASGDYKFGFVGLDDKIWTWKGEYGSREEGLTEVEKSDVHSPLEYDRSLLDIYYTRNSEYYIENGNLHVGDQVIMNEVCQGDSLESIFVRTDGSIWTYSDLLGLNKITKSTPQDNPTEDGNYITSPSIKEKKVGNQAAITGLNPNTTIQNFIGQNNFNTQYTVKVLNANKVEIEKSNLMGTGYTIQLLKNNGLVQQYIAVIYGDTTGDGQINSFDALTLIKAINNKVAFKGEAYQEAGRIMTKSGQTPTALDALAIIKSANKKYTIEQFK